MPIDPVCKMTVAAEGAVTAECDGVVYYFCSTGCQDKFLEGKVCEPRAAYELIIIGGGPAGLTAAVYSTILKTDALLLTKDLGGQAIDSAKIENYMGFDFITGPELIEKFKHQLFRSHYIDHLVSEVEKIEAIKDGFNVVTSELRTFFAPALLVATGMTRKKLQVPGEEKFLRRGIFYANIQDISFVQGKDVAVIGGGNTALQLMENLHTVARNIYLISHSQLSGDPAIIGRVVPCRNVHRYENYTVAEFTGENLLSGLTIRRMAGRETVELAVQGAFIAIGLRPNSALAASLVQLNARGEIIIQPDCSTSRPGIFAAGDVTNAFGKRIIIASGEGAKAAMAARQYLLDLRKKPCV
ncbi:MAG: FAD-dependent oxidoreductase [Thermodesulfobacteriota bacterium]